MTKRIIMAATASVLCILAASCVREKGFEERVKDITGTDAALKSIATVEEQEAQIKSSITALTDEHNKLAEYTETLEPKVEVLAAEVQEVDAKIDAVKAELADSIDKRTGALVEMLEAYQAEMEKQIKEISRPADSLKQKDKELEGKIDTLKLYVDARLDTTTNWANATFATLKQKDSLARVTAAIEVYAKKVNDRIDNLATQHSKDTVDIFKAIRALDTKSSDSLAAAVHKLDSIIQKTADDITTAYEPEIKTAVDNTDKSIRKWVSDTLSHYCTTAKVEAEINAAKADIETLSERITTADSIINALGTTTSGHSEQIKRLQDSVKTAFDRISTVRDSLKTLDEKIATTRSEITAAYKGAINDSLNTLRLVMTDSLALVNGRVAALATRMTTVEGKVTTLESQMTAAQTSITTLLADVAGLRIDVNKLLARIQSISVIPTYGNGSVGVRNQPGDSIWFDIRPASVADTLVKKYSSTPNKIFSLLMKSMSKKPETKASSFISVTLTKVMLDAASDSLVVAIFDGSEGKMPSGFFDGTKVYSGTFRINDGNTDRGSAYFPMIPLND